MSEPDHPGDPGDSGDHLGEPGEAGEFDEAADAAAADADARLRSLVRRVEELTTDIGSVLHANTSILFMTQQSIDVAIGALRPNPFAEPGAPRFEDIDAVMTGPAKNAAKAIERLVSALADRPEVLSARLADELLGSASLLADHIACIPIAESRSSTLRTIACRVQDVLDALPTRGVSRELVRDTRKTASEIERIAALASLMQTRSAILQMDYTIRSFREFVTSDMRPIERREHLVLSALIESAQTQLVEYARTSNIEVHVRNLAPDARILGVERELVRALANLLHNAIKYSWHREADHKPWVGVNVRREAQDLCIVIENWGVAISPAEISEGMIFELGYRGKWSTDRGRLGTGVGLTDAREVIAKHKGTLEVESRPARTWGPDDPQEESYYRQPFITKVTIRLPEAL